MEVKVNTKKSYESVEITVLPLNQIDVIATSAAFNGREDKICNW